MSTMAAGMGIAIETDARLRGMAEVAVDTIEAQLATMSRRGDLHHFGSIGCRPSILFRSIVGCGNAGSK
jgi:hypothetical protein